MQPSFLNLRKLTTLPKTRLENYCPNRRLNTLQNLESDAQVAKKTFAHRAEDPHTTWEWPAKMLKITKTLGSVDSAIKRSRLDRVIRTQLLKRYAWTENASPWFRKAVRRFTNAVTIVAVLPTNRFVYLVLIQNALKSLAKVSLTRVRLQ